METEPQLLARLVKHGGRVLVVGGGIADLPQNIRDHPAILLWDDDRQGMQVKEVPSNTKAILFNRWVSHATAAKLHDAARRLHTLKYPMLRTREIKSLLSEIVAEERQLPADVPEPTPAEIATVQHTQEVKEMAAKKKEQDQEQTKQIQSGKKGAVVGFVVKNLALGTDWTQRGAISQEGDRIFALAEKAGVTTTIGSVRQCVSKVVSDLGKQTSHRGGRVAKVKPTKVARGARTAKVAPFKAAGHDDFAELDRLMEEALTAIRLVQEHLPIVKKETERLRNMRQQMLDMLK